MTRSAMRASPGPSGCKVSFQALADQQAGRTTLTAAMIDQKLGKPFRRDAMKKSVAIAGIDRASMASS